MCDAETRGYGSLSASPCRRMRRLLLSTNSPDKVREFREILAGLPLEIVTPADLGLNLEVAETGATFAENAALKARAYHQASGLLSLADDSGLEVDALGGAPGVFSARYGGLPNGEPKNRLLLQQLEEYPGRSGAAATCARSPSWTRPAGCIGAGEP